MYLAPMMWNSNFFITFESMKKAARRGEDFSRKLRRRAERTGPGTNFEISGFKFQRDGRPGESPFLEAGGNLLSLAPKNSFERTGIGDIAVVSAETLLVSRSALTLRVSMPRASRARRRPSSP